MLNQLEVVMDRQSRVGFMRELCLISTADLAEGIGVSKQQIPIYARDDVNVSQGRRESVDILMRKVLDGLKQLEVDPDQLDYLEALIELGEKLLKTPWSRK